MITEDYVSFEIAKLLKEKGFKEPISELNKLLCKEGEKPLLLITHQKAMKWLRTKGVFFCVHPDHPTSKDFMIEFYNDGQPSGCFGNYKIYEDAVEAALKYSLENLI